MRELWKPIPGYVGRYEASSLGRVRSLRGSKYKWDPPRILARRRSMGYWSVSLIKNKRHWTVGVHKAVAMAFIRVPKKGEVVRHLDGSRTNNVPSNLAVGSIQENVDDRTRHGRTARGERGGFAKLRAKIVREIRRQYFEVYEMDQYEIAEHFGIGQSHVSRIIRGETWKHLWK